MKLSLPDACGSLLRRSWPVICGRLRLRCANQLGLGLGLGGHFSLIQSFSLSLSHFLLSLFLVSPAGHCWWRRRRYRTRNTRLITVEVGTDHGWGFAEFKTPADVQYVNAARTLLFAMLVREARDICPEVNGNWSSRPPRDGCAPSGRARRTSQADHPRRRGRGRYVCCSHRAGFDFADASWSTTRKPTTTT